MLLRARQFEFRFPGPALVMGIVNVTPDSFSDGGQFGSAEDAANYALKLVKEGAAIIDIGGESTRPRAVPVPEAEELARVLPVIRLLAGRVDVPISIDTMKAGVARAAIEAGASIVNDVAANRSDNELWRIVAETGVGYVCMHMQGTPQTMQNDPHYEDVVAEVGDFLLERVRCLTESGVKTEQIILDPGIGFGKSLEHNLQLLGNLRRFTTLERPVLVGVSRKSFISRLLGTELAARLPGALSCAALAIESGVQIIRAHDVAETVQAARMVEAILKNRK